MNKNVLTGQESKILTILKGLAILMVIMIHCDFRDRLPYDYSQSLDLYGQCLTREVVFNAVPLFFFVSGFLFFLNKGSVWDKWKKRIKTLLVPYLIWCTLYFLYLFFMQRVLGLYIILLILTMVFYSKDSSYYQLSHNMFMILNSVFIFKIVSLLVSKYEMKRMLAISGASFFIYLAHEPWISYFQTFFYKGVHAPEFVIAIMPWFFVALAVCYTYVGYLLLKKYLPSVLNALTGAR